VYRTLRWRRSKRCKYIVYIVYVPITFKFDYCYLEQAPAKIAQQWARKCKQLRLAITQLMFLTAGPAGGSAATTMRGAFSASTGPKSPAAESAMVRVFVYTHVWSSSVGSVRKALVCVFIYITKTGANFAKQKKLSMKVVLERELRRRSLLRLQVLRFQRRSRSSVRRGQTYMKESLKLSHCQVCMLLHIYAILALTIVTSAS
jgi:hypothetical protein